MDDALLASGLAHLLKRYLRTRLINRLIAYVLVNLCVYVLLLAVVILADSSLFVFHLLLFCSLSLLPVFLLVGAERTTLWRVVRSIDEHCLVESYLRTQSGEHRAFMRRRIETHLQRLKTGKPFPFRLFRGNLYLIGICLLLFAVLQATSFMVLQDFTVALSAGKIKNRLNERNAMEQTVAELPVEQSEGAAGAEDQELKPTAGGKTGEQRIGKTAEEEALEELLADEPMVAKDRIQSLGPEDFREDTRPAEQSGETEWRYRIPGTETDSAPERTTGLAGEEGRDSSREGSGAEAGSSDVGRTFRESPIRDYTTVTESLSATGSEELSPSTNVAESSRQKTLDAVFSNFQSISYLSITFDPLFETIRERYLELLDERF